MHKAFKESIERYLRSHKEIMKSNGISNICKDTYKGGFNTNTNNIK